MIQRVQVILGSALAAAIVVGLAAAGGTVGVAGVGFVLTWLVFVVWPWAVLPTGIIGGTMASALIGDTSVRMMVTMHLVAVVAGYLAVLARRALGYDRDLVPRSYHRAVVVVALALTAAAVYGLAVGNSGPKVLIATYQIAVLPAYFFLGIYTLATPRWRRPAAILFLVPVTVVTAISITQPGQHGGLLSLIAVPPLMVLVGQCQGWPRAGLAVAAAILATDVILSSFRGLWLAGGIVILVLAVRGGRVIRRGILITAVSVAAGLLFVTLVGLSTDLQSRSATVSAAIDRDAGYRLPEALVGLRAFESAPIFGAGLGQSTPQVYLTDFGTVDVGPMYHAFYVLILANVGLLGLVVIAWPILRTVHIGLTEPEGMTLAFAALICGFLVDAMVTGPSEGHWELGLLPALILLTRQTTRPVRAVPWWRPANRSRHLMALGGGA